MGRKSFRTTVHIFNWPMTSVLVVLISATAFAAVAADASPSDSSALSASDEPSGESSLLDLDLDQLARVDVLVPSMNTEVTTVSKQESTIGHSPAAVFVITNEMIRRSGATSLPEVLRMVPGLEVARMESNSWAVTSRGFNDHYANKLLVLIDGRTVYTPTFSGVWWDVQDMLLEDIDRIEVIRGPGGTLWGANAVNGVINVITRSAKDTQGTIITYGAGSEDRSIGGFRLGGNNGQGLSWRIYGKHFERDRGYDPTNAHDDWRMGRAGFRVDWDLDRCECNKLTVQGDYYVGREGHLLEDVLPESPYVEYPHNNEVVYGNSVLARWTHTFDEDSDWTLQAYFDRTLRDERQNFEKVDTFDIEFQHRFSLGDRHKIIWGLDYRYVHNNIRECFKVGFDPSARTAPFFSGFVQDEITLVEDRLAFTIGTKLEENSFSGFECQPSARLLWTPDDKHSAWAAVSRAVHIPSWFQQDAWVNTPPVQFGSSSPWIYPRLTGDQDSNSENLMAYEVGYRAQVIEGISFDTAAFYNVYDDLIGVLPGDVWTDGTHSYMPLLLTNSVRGETYGLELLGQWTISEDWRLAASYTFLQINLHGPGTGDSPQAEGASPHNQITLRSYWDLSPHWELDLAVRYVDELPTLSVPSYISADVRIAWTPSDRFEFSVVGQNLLDNHHLEFSGHGSGVSHTEVERAVFAKATWRY